MSLNEALFSSKDMTWETPQDLFDKLNEVFNFDIDVCALEENAKCEKYFTPEIDGLSQKWTGTCWVNPPYGRQQVKWLYKASEEIKLKAKQIILLIPARPDTKVWHDVIFKNASFVCFIKGRLKFGGSKDSAPFPSAIVVFGDISKEQEKCLKSLGKLFMQEVYNGQSTIIA